MPGTSFPTSGPWRRRPNDLQLALNTTIDRASRALLLAAGISVDALSDREKVAIKDSADLTVAVYNRGKAKVALVGGNAVVEAQSTPLVPLIRCTSATGSLFDASTTCVAPNSSAH